MKRTFIIVNGCVTTLQYIQNSNSQELFCFTLFKILNWYTMTKKEFNDQKVDLAWIVNGVVKEVIERNKTRRQLSFTRAKLRNSTHKTGTLIYLVTGTHKY